MRTLGRLVYRGIYRLAEIVMMAAIGVGFVISICWSLYMKDLFTLRRADWPFETWVSMIGPRGGKEENKT